ncbi:MAG: sirohydrochlorin chelatase, partial [Promethearchaeota archaeon]
IEKEVKTLMSQNGNNQFSAIRVAFMEFTEPSINTVIKDFENIGIDRVYAIPLLVAPSGHSLFDIPTILGLYSEKNIINEIKSEGTDIVNTNIKITIGPTLNNSDILKNSMLDRVKELSTTPDSEGVVLLAHGDKHFEPIWASMCREIGYYVCAKTGIEYFDYAFVEIGQSFATEGVSTILKATERKEKIIVVGLYLSMGVERMASTSALFMMGKKTETKKLFADKNILFAKRGILPDKRISEWIVEIAIEWVEGLQ